jgi:exosortase B
MSTADAHGADTLRPDKLSLVPPGFDWSVFAILAVGFCAVFAPTFYELAHTVWATDEQGHGPIILVVSWWLLFNRRFQIAEAAGRPNPVAGWSLLVFAMLMFVVGRSQQVLMFQAAAQILVLIGLLMIFRGIGAVKAAWFPIFFLIFMIPLPEALVAAVTSPLKSAVSYVASGILYQLGYPIGRSGVTLTIGQYQLLVADACAGLNSMFTLEALGLLYMNLMRYTAFSRNLALVLVLVPISFVANVTRVMVLVLVTYYFGDAVGQGFVHGFAGMLLFLVALALMMCADRVLGLFLPGARA